MLKKCQECGAHGTGDAEGLAGILSRGVHTLGPVGGVRFSGARYSPRVNTSAHGYMKRTRLRCVDAVNNGGSVQETDAQRYMVLHSTGPYAAVLHASKTSSGPYQAGATAQHSKQHARSTLECMGAVNNVGWVRETNTQRYMVLYSTGPYTAVLHTSETS
jgi:predicted xylose isomerase-like sugar epimerase